MSLCRVSNACPGRGHTTSTTFQELAKQIDDFLRAQMPVWRVQYPGVEGLRVAVMGCIVNGPGESKHADIGISLPGTGEAPAAPVFIDGEKALTPRGENIAAEFRDIVESMSRAGSEATRRQTPMRCEPLYHSYSINIEKHRRESTEKVAAAPKSGKVTSVKGMNDIPPPDSARWEWLEGVVRSLMGPLCLSKNSSPHCRTHCTLCAWFWAQVTHIVEKEMYSFEDRLNGEHLSCGLRPLPEEWSGGFCNNFCRMTVNVVLHGADVSPSTKAQRGRYRQFHQIGAEALGFPGAEIDAELILLANALWHELGLQNVRLELK